MSKPTIYIECSSHARTDPDLIRRIALGTDLMLFLSDDSPEPDICVTDEIAIANTLIKRTRQTSIIIVCSEQWQYDAALSFASRRTTRLHVVYTTAQDWTPFINEIHRLTTSRASHSSH